MSYDLVIKNGVVIDGSGMPRYRGDVGVVGGPDRGGRAHPGVRARGDRRRRPGRGARLRRRAYAHGRPGLLGPPRHLLVLARRDERGHGQLRLHARPVRQVGPASRREKSRARGGHRGRGDGRGHRLDVDHLPGVPHRRRRAAQGHQLRGLPRPLRAAHVCDGRARLRQGRDRGRSRARWSASCADGAHRGRHGLHDLAVAQPRDAGPPARGEPPRELGRGAAAGRRHGRDERGHLRDRGRALQRSRRACATTTCGCATSPWRRGGRSRGASSAAARTRPLWRTYIALLEETARAGGRMFAQVHSRALTVVLSFKTNLPFDRLPVWKELRALPLEEQKRRLRDPELRGTPRRRRARARRAPPDRRGGARRLLRLDLRHGQPDGARTARSPTSRGSAAAIPSRP